MAPKQKRVDNRWACKECVYQNFKGKNKPPYLNPQEVKACKSCGLDKSQCCSPTTSLAERQLQREKAAKKQQQQAKKASPSVANTNDNKEKANQAAKLQKENEQLRSQIAALKKEPTTEGNANQEGEPDAEGMSKENWNKVKALNRKKAWMLSWDDEERCHMDINNQAEFDAAVDKIRIEKETLLASNRSLRPTKTQHDKQTKFVEKLTTELAEAKATQLAILVQWEEISEDIAKQQVYLDEKKAELAVLSDKLHQEDSEHAKKDYPPKSEGDASNPAEAFTKLGIEGQELQVLCTLLGAIAETNICEILQQKGATTPDLKKVVATWTKLG